MKPDYTVGLLHELAARLPSLPRLDGNVQTVIDAVGSEFPLATSAEELTKHLRTAKAYHVLSRPPHVAFVQGKDRKAMEAIATKAEKLLKKLPNSFGDATMHILWAAEQDFREENQAVLEKVSTRIEDMDQRLNEKDANIGELRSELVEIKSIQDRILGYGLIPIQERLRRMRSDLDYLTRLVDTYEERKKTWKPDLTAWFNRSKRDLADEQAPPKHDVWESILLDNGDPSLIVRRQVIGDWLPELFTYHFGREFGVSNARDGLDGPGMRFVDASVRLMGIMQDDGSPYSRAALRWYWKHAENHNKRGLASL